MSDFQLLYVVLVLIYLSDCVFWVRRGSVVLRGWLGRTCGVAHPSTGFGSTQAGVVALNPLPPFGRAFVVSQWPLSLSTEGASSFVKTVPQRYERPQQLGYYVRFRDVRSVTRDGAKLLVNGKLFAVLNSEGAALEMSRLMVRLARLSREKRETAIEAALQRSMNVEAVERRLRRFRQAAAGLRFQAHAIALTLFALVPLTIGRMEFRRFLLSGLILLGGLLLINAVAFALAHRQLYPWASGTRFKAAFTMVFTPPAAIRVRDTLSRDLLARFDPTAAALVLCGAAEREAWIRKVWRDAIFPMRGGRDDESAEQAATVDQFHERYRRALEGTVRGAGYGAFLTLEPPARSDPSCHSYCPRCEMQFVLMEGECTHCGGIPLEPLAGQKETQGAESSLRR